MLLFVMETKISRKRTEKLCNALGFSGSFAVSSDGLSGGIGLFWKAEVIVELKNFSSNHIDVLVQQRTGGVKWRFTGFYGEPRRENRHNSWTLLRRLSNALSYPWLCMGDFNETLVSSEHLGANARPEAQMRAFRECVEDCGLIDVGWTGSPFTWDNRQADPANVKARIDRAFGNDALYAAFKVDRVRHVDFVASDHCVLVMRL
jgi:hypothetical protein